MIKLPISFLIFCIVLKKELKNKDQIKGVTITYILPNFLHKPIRYDTLVTEVYIHNNVFLYNLSYINDSLINGKLISSEIRNHFVIYSKDSTYGYNYDRNIKKRVLIDSTFKEEWIKNNDMYHIITDKKSILVSSHKNIASDTLQEYYEFRIPNDTSLKGSCILSYTNSFNDIGISLSRKIDSTKKMKVYRIEEKSFDKRLKTYGLNEAKSIYNMNKIKTIRPEIVKIFEEYIAMQKKSR